MSKVVLDASAIIAVLRGEPGHEYVIPYLAGSLVSTINVAEVLCTARSFGSNPEKDSMALQMMQLKRMAFVEEQARIVASIYSQTSGSSIGIADRACLSLGIMHKLPVLTGDRTWAACDVGVEVRLFRD
jgi:ribonuclease VapC